MQVYSLKLYIKIAAKPLHMEIWLLLTTYKNVATALSDRTIADYLRLTV